MKLDSRGLLLNVKPLYRSLDRRGASLKAIEAAIEVVEHFGLQVHEPLLLRSTNNVVAWLRPTPIVAKVGIGHHPGFLREIRVASELQALHAPVISPAPEVPAVVHSRNGFNVTFWRYHPQPSDWECYFIRSSRQRCDASMRLMPGSQRS